MRNYKKQTFVSIIWCYPKYFYNFAKEEHYHLHALKIAKDLGYEVVVLIRNEVGIIENDPLFDKSTKVIYYSNLFNYILHISKSEWYKNLKQTCQRFYFGIPREFDKEFLKV